MTIFFCQCSTTQNLSNHTILCIYEFMTTDLGLKSSLFLAAPYQEGVATNRKHLKTRHNLLTNLFASIDRIVHGQDRNKYQQSICY